MASSGPIRKVLDTTFIQATIRSNEEPRHRSSSQRQMSRDESTLEMRERAHDYNKGEMGGPVSHSSHQGHSSSRDKDHVRRSNTSDKNDRDSKGSSSSRSSKEHDRERVKDKPLPPPGDNAYLKSIHEDRKDRHEDRSTHHSSSRLYPDLSKGRPAPPQETLVNLDHTHAEHVSRKDREYRKEAQESQVRGAMNSDSLASKPKGDPSPSGDPSGKPEEKPTQDVNMKSDEGFNDIDMESEDYVEIRKIQEAVDEADAKTEAQTQQDLQLAIAVQQQELEASKGHGDRDHQRHQRGRHPDGSSSEEETDSEEESPGAAQAAEGQGFGSKLYSFVAGSTSTPATKDQEVRHWKKQYKKAAQAYQETQYHLHKKTKDAQQFYEQGYKFYMENGALQRRVEMMDQERKALAAELGHTKQQLSDAINLSEVRGKELKGAQVFLTKADSLSVSDVVQKVSALNEEIFQAGALLAETLIYQVADADMAEHTQRRQAVIADTREPVGRYLGNTLADLLCNESMKPQEGPANQLLVQIVLIIALTRWCSSVCRGWVPEDPETSNFLQDLYDGIRRAEDQAVAGRWRSLTRAHLEIAADGWTQDVMRVITCILGLAGWETQTPEDLSQFEKRLSSIFKALRDVRKATGEDVTSADLEVYAIHRGDEFEPTQMEDSYGDDRAGASAQGGEKERVAGPSGLGLRKVMVIKTKERYEKRAEYLSLPKVVLEKTVKEAIEPPPPPKSRRRRDQGEPGGKGAIRQMIGL